MVGEAVAAVVEVEVAEVADPVALFDAGHPLRVHLTQHKILPEHTSAVRQRPLYFQGLPTIEMR